MDSKHCIDKFRDLVKLCKMQQKEGRQSTSFKDDFGERKQHLHDIVSEMNDESSRRQERKDADARRDNRLQPAYREIRE